MNGYAVTSGVMDLGVLTTGTVVWSLTNPSASAKQFFIKRLRAVLGFSGVAAATRVGLGLCKATGTPAGGTASQTGSNIPKRDSGNPNSVAQHFYGPTAITGHTLGNDFKSTHINHQNGTPLWDDLIEDVKDFDDTDTVKLGPGESLCLVVRGTSVAGSGVSIDAEWNEV